MRGFEFATRCAALRLLFLSVVVGTAACTSFDHFESQSRLERGLRQLQIANQTMFADAKKATDPAVAASPLETSSPDVARANLASDAKRDLESVSGVLADASPLDRISALHRAGIKAWKAGEIGGPIVKEISDKGRAACGGVKPPPDRDCGMFELIPRLAAAEAAIARLDGVQVRLALNKAGRGDPLGSEDIKTMGTAVADLKKSFDVLSLARDGKAHPDSGIANGVSPLLYSTIDGQLVLMWCHAYRIQTFLTHVPVPAGVGDAAPSRTMRDVAFATGPLPGKLAAAWKELTVSLYDKAEVDRVAGLLPEAIPNMTKSLKDAVDPKIPDQWSPYCAAFGKRILEAQSKLLDIDRRF